MERATLFDLYPGAMDNEQARDADKRLYVKFFTEAVPDQLATEGGYIDKEEFDPERKAQLEKLGCRFRPIPKDEYTLRVLPCGRPVFRDATLVWIQKPGDRDNINVREANEQDKNRFPQQYANFLKGEAEAVIGTPLNQVPWVSPALREEFAFFGIRTVEQLATLPDGVAQKFQGIHQLRERAKKYVSSAEQAKPFEEVHEELKIRDTVIEEQAQTIKALESRLLALEEDRRPNRKGSSRE